MKLRTTFSRCAAAAAAVASMLVAAPGTADAVVSTSCSGYNLSDPRAPGPIRVFFAGTPGVRCFNRDGHWTTLLISQVWEIDGGSNGAIVTYRDSAGKWHQGVSIPANGYLSWSWGGPGVFLQEML